MGTTTKTLDAGVLGFAVIVTTTLIASSMNACSLFVDTDGLSETSRGGDSGTSPDGSQATDGSNPDDGSVAPDANDPDAPLVESGPCPATTGGPPMVRVVHGAISFCIDATEVSKAHYATFLASNPSTSAQIPECAANVSFVPVDAWPPNSVTRTRAVVGLDWCDANAFCAWAGKRLCGRVGGGTLPIAELKDATKNEWYIACSRGGAFRYPYGGVYVKDACSEEGIIDVGSRPQCEGGYSGIFDMSGNAHEWINACDGAACAISGSGYIHPAPEMVCDFFYTGPRTAQIFDPVNDSETGFRCCR